MNQKISVTGVSVLQIYSSRDLTYDPGLKDGSNPNDSSTVSLNPRTLRHRLAQHRIGEESARNIELNASSQVNRIEARKIPVNQAKTIRSSTLHKAGYTI